MEPEAASATAHSTDPSRLGGTNDLPRALGDTARAERPQVTGQRGLLLGSYWVPETKNTTQRHGVSR